MQPNIPVLVLAMLAVVIVFLLIRHIDKLPKGLQKRLKEKWLLAADYTPPAPGALKIFQTLNVNADTQAALLSHPMTRQEAVQQNSLFISPLLGNLKVKSGFRTKNRPNHMGVDILVPLMTPVVAASAGKIARALLGCAQYYDKKSKSWESSARRCGGGAGNNIIIRHANDYSSTYMHLTSFAPGIKNGVQVAQGELIGYSGTTGNSTAPHLHFEIKHGRSHVDPEDYLP